MNKSKALDITPGGGAMGEIAKAVSDGLHRKANGFAAGMAIINAICLIDADREGWKKEVVSVMRHCPPWLFRMLDEKPGRWGRYHDGVGWHTRLRLVRNDARAGVKLFESLGKEVTV